MAALTLHPDRLLPADPGVRSLARRLYSDELNRRIVNKRGEGANRIRAAADARDDGAGKSPRLREHLLPRFAADHGLEVAHHSRIGRGSDDGALAFGECAAETQSTPADNAQRA